LSTSMTGGEGIVYGHKKAQKSQKRSGECKSVVDPRPNNCCFT
jgi:hypothetical protein